jgi:hypothetical protein
MSATADISEPASELEHLIAELSESGLLVFVFGAGWCTAHLTGVTTPVFRGPTGRRWWHVDLGDGTASWTMDVRVDEITWDPVRARAIPAPLIPGAGGLDRAVPRARPEDDAPLLRHDLYDGQRMRPEKLAGAARALRQPRRVPRPGGDHVAPATRVV